MHHASNEVKLLRKGTGHILAVFHLPSTMSSARRPSSRLHGFLQEEDARSLDCTSELIDGKLTISVVLNPNREPPEMPERLKNFKLALRKLIGEVPIEVDYSGLH